MADGKTAIKGTPSGQARGRTIVTGGKGTATRTAGLLGAICQFAVEQGLLAENPCRRVKRFPDRRMNRFLDEGELSRLGSALVDAE